MIAKFTLKLVRWHSEPETRWFRRVVLRKKWRYHEDVLFSAPAPPDMVLRHRLNAPSTLSFSGPVEDGFGALLDHPTT